MNYFELIKSIKEKKSFLCIGLDPDTNKVHPDKILDFNKKIIDETRDLCVAYKPNIAFYEHLGIDGWIILEKTIEYIGEDHLKIADAKRGDIGNTGKFYAKTFFETYNFDGITLSPYMGSDSIDPFLNYKNKFSILLALTSNQGSTDFQTPDLFKLVLEKSKNWSSKENLMYVVGATKAESLKEIRQIVPDNFLLIPGVGEQGGDFDKVCEWGLNKECGLLINSSRQIIFSDKPKEEAKKLQSKMEGWLEKINFV